MKDKGPNLSKLVKTNSALDLLKNNTSSATTSEGIIFEKIHSTVFNYYTIKKISISDRLIILLVCEVYTSHTSALYAR